jgi:hypothetical protein
MSSHSNSARTLLSLFVVALGIGNLSAVVQAGTTSKDSLEGRWAATIVQDDLTIPFRLDISGNGSQVVGNLYNGANDFETTTSEKVENGSVELNFEHYLTSITASLKDGDLDGELAVKRRSAINITPGAPQREVKDNISKFHAKRYVAPSAAALNNVPNIDGVWEMPHESPKGEKSWRLIVQQKGAEISTTVLRVDGDAGALTGEWQNGKFIASHFDGARPGLIQVTPQTRRNAASGVECRAAQLHVNRLQAGGSTGERAA